MMQREQIHEGVKEWKTHKNIKSRTTNNNETQSQLSTAGGQDKNSNDHDNFNTSQLDNNEFFAAPVGEDRPKMSKKQETQHLT